MSAEPRNCFTCRFRYKSLRPDEWGGYPWRCSAKGGNLTQYFEKHRRLHQVRAPLRDTLENGAGVVLRHAPAA
ncbi:MAG TPA: hypothetical protein PKI71_12680 [Candidatus Rifleibacterium sp.]|nr:hypothetical protein [Candidatus Rifleibacterium sp.]